LNIPPPGGNGKAHDPITNPRLESERLLADDYRRRQKAEEAAKEAYDQAYKAYLKGEALLPDPPRPRPETVIATFFQDKYDFVFRRGTAAYSRRLSREISAEEARAAASDLIIRGLAEAADAPRHPDGSLKRNGLPGFFRTWVPIAWQNLLDGLPDEQDASEIVPSAQEQFRARVRAGLLHLEAVSFGHKAEGKGELDIQRRSLIALCQAFAKPGNWANVRPHSNLLWTRKDSSGGLEVALRSDLFAQVPKCGELAKLSQNAFGRLCELYAVGQSIRAGGYRAVALTREFIDELLAEPANSNVRFDDSVDDSGSPEIRAGKNAKTSTETSTQGICHRGMVGPDQPSAPAVFDEEDWRASLGPYGEGY
jgi:hypothetical protein